MRRVMRKYGPVLAGRTVLAILIMLLLPIGLVLRRVALIVGPVALSVPLALAVIILV